VIARLEGVLAEKRPDLLLLDVSGVGYEVRVSLLTFLALPDEGKTLRLRIHTHVREDAFQLYGFLTDEERALFRQLLGISGIGPKLAVSILSGLPPDQLAAAIRAGDVSRLTAIPGVGKKTAERIVVDLRDKLAAPTVVRQEQEPRPGDVEQAAVSALVNLGYPQAHAEKAARRALELLPEGARLEAAIVEALRVAAG
jgi:Holliday junction DNA helicase RuvA